MDPEASPDTRMESVFQIRLTAIAAIDRGPQEQRIFNDKAFFFPTA